MPDNHSTWELFKIKPRDLMRTRVPGGWLYRTVEHSQGGEDTYPESVSVALCFVPDNGE